MPTYFPFSQVIGNIAEQVSRRVVRHNYSAPWTVTNPKLNVQPVAVAVRQISEIYY